MKAYDIIAKKRDKKELSQEEIDFFVKGVSQNSIPDEQTAAWLMAIRLNGMSSIETANLAVSMAESGVIADLSAIKGIKVDKHSTGGVADGTTLVAVPLAAACGVKVAKMSGRSLGHTGGTLDKLWSIPGYNTDLSIKQMVDQVNDIGCALIGQTGELAPADKKLYALRDITATVESLPLIASSILSKKIAAGCEAIVLDVKCGNGAFMKDENDAVLLAEAMVGIGKEAGRNIIALVTDMDQPLGRNIGNSLEVVEAVEILSGKCNGRLEKLSKLLAAHMVYLSGNVDSLDAAQALVETAVSNGSGLEMLRRLIAAQSGDSRIVDYLSLLPQASHKVPVIATSSGYITKIDCEALGLAAQRLGAGRLRKEDTIDYSAGIIMCVELGTKISNGETLAYLQTNNANTVDEATHMVVDAIKISDSLVAPQPLVIKTITE